MKIIKISFILLSFVNCFSCKENTTSESNNVISSTIQATTSSVIYYWVSEEYLNCMKTNLPNECFRQIEFPIVKYINNEQYIYLYNNFDIVRRSDVRIINYEYFAYTTPYSKVPYCKISLNNDTLFLKVGRINHKYIYSPNLNTIDCRDKMVGKLNLNQIMTRLSKYGFDLYEKLNVCDSTYLYFANEIGEINLISTIGNRENNWILEESSNKIFIYKYLNLYESKSRWAPCEIRKKLMFSIVINSP
jgi:hypothetical protein